jgi:hypothetical protein
MAMILMVLSAKWLGQREIEISFCSGRVTNFTNYASVYRGGPDPMVFHATLRDENKNLSAIPPPCSK